MRLAVAFLALAATATGFAPGAPRQGHHAVSLLSPHSPLAPFAPAPAAAASTRLFANAGVAVDGQAVVDEALAAGDVTLFGKSGCPFCKKTKKALYAIGVHPTVVELDEIDGGAIVQKKLVSLALPSRRCLLPSRWARRFAGSTASQPSISPVNVAGGDHRQGYRPQRLARR